MPRKPRLHVPGGYYHVTLRGNNKNSIFRCVSDHNCLNELVSQASEEFDFGIHAFCWMSNHLHMAIQISDIPLGRSIHWLTSQYVKYFNRRYERTGHLFEKRYYANFVDEDTYLLELVRYIHRNPVNAGIVDNPINYAWSSHRFYLGHGRLEWLRTNMVLKMFAVQPDRAARLLHDFVTGGERDEWEDDFVNKHGSDGIPVRLRPPPNNDSVSGNSRLPHSLDDIVKSVCHRHCVDPAIVEGPSRQRSVAIIRAEIAESAIRLGVANISEVGRRLNRSEVAIGKLLRRHSATE